MARWVKDEPGPILMMFLIGTLLTIAFAMLFFWVTDAPAVDVCSPEGVPEHAQADYLDACWEDVLGEL